MSEATAVEKEMRFIERASTPQPPCPHCGSTDDECWWWEFHDGDDAPCGAQQEDDSHE